MENKKEKNALKSKLLMGLLSLVIAFGLWLYVVTVVSPESEKTIYNIPVGLQSESVLEERGLMVTTEDIPTVNLRLKGNRTDLDKLTNANITVVADVSRIGEAGEHSLSYSIAFPGDVPNNAISTQKRTPDTVSITVEERISKSIKVHVNVDQETVSEGFRVDTENAKLSTAELLITGPKRILEQVDRATVFVDVAGKKESVNNQKLPYTLVDRDGAPVDDSMVEDNLETPGVITLEKLTIGQVKEISLAVDVIAGGGADSSNTEVTVSPQIITVFGSTKLLESLGDVMVVGTVDLGKITEDMQIKFPIQLPDGITCESGETEVVADILLPQLSVKTLNVTQISLINPPNDMTAQIITKVLEITVRGPGELIDTIDETNVRVTADMKGVPEGTQTLPVTITTTGDYAGVGAVGTYTVSAVLKKR